MYISEIIVDGFKSYAQKTVISGFDPQFNAITGLNGSGKSNILDSICFVLGISNLSQVRVGNLQELVYKQGQAGVTKASVTIVFNNSDSANSPVGYESHKQITVTRQVIIGGKNKYMINGHTVQQNQVQNLFHSVQLNVNNPHFLIMQGRITKVLNMKPPEILSMIEEAAGTRMFETKKQAALKTIEKKQQRVEELSKCMNEEITPTLEGLRTERQNYVSWQSNNSEVERLEKLCVAFAYNEADSKVKGAESDRVKLENEILNLQTVEKSKLDEVEKITTKIAQIEQQRDKENQSGLQILKKREADVSKELVRINTLLSNQKDLIQSESESLTNSRKQVDQTTTSLSKKEKELASMTAQVVNKEDECHQSERNAANLLERYQNACAGVADNQSSTDVLSLPEQIATWERRSREASSQLKQISIKIEHTQKSIRDLNKTATSQKTSFEQTQKESEVLKSAIDSLESQLHSVSQPNSLPNENTLRQKAGEIKVGMTKLRDSIDNLTANIEAKLNFEFRDPERGFDRRRVKGMVAKLVRIKDKATSTALEIAAGVKLYQVVVDNEQTGKMLLEKGQLRKRVTILPLNRLSARCTEPSKVQRSKEIASSMGGKAFLALELVGYEQELSRAMEYVFGSTIICENSEIAKAIAFDKAVRNRTVTLDGDSYDPAGTLTGGAKSQIGVLLSRIEELSESHQKLDEMEASYADVNKMLAQAESLANKSREISNTLDLKKHEFHLCSEKLKSTSYAHSMDEIERQKAEVIELEKKSTALEIDLQNANNELVRLKSSESDSKKQREKAMKDLENQMKQATKQSSTLKSQLNSLRNSRDAIQAEITSLTGELESLREQIVGLEKNLARIQKEQEEFEQQVIGLRGQYDQIKNEMAQIQDAIHRSSKEIKHLQSNQERIQKEAQQANLDARKVQHQLKQWEKDCKDAAKVLNNLIKEHPWIQRELTYFGVPGSDYDFSGRDINQCNRRLKEIKAEQEKLAKRINKKVMGMIEKAESEYEDLSKKRDTILKDKNKIESVIEELDIKKSQALQTTWIKVNRDFGSIFSMLLPGTHAKLEPPENGSINDGLEVKVAFNGVWKESLTELSGGQRSLLALSLILSLLLFKPAPMYILDEVDAALDLSHTQNIGLILKTHFSNSQFIVVSLKEGMFNNANVIFRTKFVDGVSTVTRTVTGGRSKQAIETSNMNNDVMDDLVKNSDENEPSKKKSKNQPSKRKGSEMMDV